MAIPLITENKLEYHFFRMISTARQVQFRVKAPNDAYVALTTRPQVGDPMYEVIIGGWKNSKSVVRKNRTKPDVAEAETPNILSTDKERGFCIRWDKGILTVGKEGESGPFLSYADPEPFGIGYFGVCTGWGATGEWLIEEISVEVLSPLWCKVSGGMVPPDAVEGGNDGELLFVGRAHHEGALIPGKVKVHSVCYVAWDGAEHEKSDYEILCGFKSKWLSTSGDNIPPKAVPGGKTENGEQLFIGRVHHKDAVIIGKVQPSHSVCYISYAGSEIAFSEYEILVEI